MHLGHVFVLAAFEMIGWGGGLYYVNLVKP